MWSIYNQKITSLLVQVICYFSLNVTYMGTFVHLEQLCSKKKSFANFGFLKLNIYTYCLRSPILNFCKKKFLKILYPISSANRQYHVLHSKREVLVFLGPIKESVLFCNLMCLWLRSGRSSFPPFFCLSVISEKSRKNIFKYNTW